MKQNPKAAAKKTTVARKKVIDAQQQADTQAVIVTFPQDYNGQVAYKAYEIFQQRGFQHGYDLDDWFQAERIIKESIGS
jgi:hypothetical protein